MNDPTNSAPTLRKRAEEKLHTSQITSPDVLSHSEMQRLLHELQVHQIELEMQNDELRMAQDELQRQIKENVALIENLKIAKDQAEAANRAKTEFLNNMSHELRTPLNGMLGMAQLLKMSELSDKQQSYLNTHLLCGSKLVRLTSDLLDLAKIEANKIELEQLDFDLHVEIAGTMTILALSAKEKGLALTTQIDPDVPLLLRGDPFRLCQIIDNLVNNAIKFTATGEVSLHICKDMEDGRQTTLRFLVHDSGIGIAADKLEIIFASFTQVDGSMTRKFGGTGLGLTISRQLAELMGGNIHVASVQGEGTNFCLTVTLDKRAEQPVVSPVITGDKGLLLPKLPSGTTVRILLVEDDLASQFGLMSIIEHSGYQVAVAGNGQRALDLLAEHDFDLVLMDCSMPVMDGYQATAIIRNQTSTVRNHDIPIIALTGFSQKKDHCDCLAAGMNDFLSKPILIADLLTKVEQWTAV